MPTKREKRAKQKDEYTNPSDRLEKRGGDFTASYLKVPEGLEMFKPSKEEHTLIFLPYRVGKGNPYADPGKLHFERTFYTHRGIGPNKRTYCCPAKMADKSCPVCEWVNKQRKKLDDEELKELDLFPKERQLFLVIDTEEREKGVQLFDFSYHLLGKQLDNKLRRIQSKNEKDPKLRFWRLDGGMIVTIEFEEKKYQKTSYYTAEGFTFKERKKDPKVEIDELPCLDDIPYVIKSDKLKEIFLQTADEDDEDDEDEDEVKNKKKKGRKKEDDDEDEEEDEDDEEDDDDDEDSGDDDEDDEEEDDEDDDGDDDEEGEEDDDEDSDDEDDDDSDDDEGDSDEEDEDDEDDGDEDGDDEDGDDDEDDDDEDDEEDEEDDDEKPVKKKKKKGKREVPFDTDEDEEDDDEEEEDDEGDEEEDEDDDEEGTDSGDDDDDPTADEAGIEVGSKVKHKKFGICKVVHISPDGTSLRLETKSGETKRGVAPAEVKVLEGKKKKGKKK